MVNPIAIEIDSIPEAGIKYSICTLVSRLSEYQEMMDSFIKAGFDPSFCEFLYIDNSLKNKYGAYSALNKFLLLAKGKYVIFCHQDILLNYDTIDVLEKSIQELDELDPKWAILSNAGAVGIKNIVYRITESDLVLKKYGHTPARVVSVDENFILLKRSSNLSLSSNIEGFHLYGTDLCMIAHILGYHAYVVNFNLLHKSKGNINEAFVSMRSSFINKYRKALKGRYIQTTCTKFYISGSALRNVFFNTALMMFLSRQYYKWKFRDDRGREPE
jgi:hypothetical protein